MVPVGWGNSQNSGTVRLCCLADPGCKRVQRCFSFGWFQPTPMFLLGALNTNFIQCQPRMNRLLGCLIYVSRTLILFEGRYHPNYTINSESRTSWTSGIGGALKKTLPAIRRVMTNATAATGVGGMPISRTEPWFAGS